MQASTPFHGGSLLFEGIRNVARIYERPDLHSVGFPLRMPTPFPPK